ncbi:hypothetical protein CCR75_006333 [Bremia lactucae]|uniref:RxLR effector protein n=1 Tax=Bremia lactucae TaxID=4779 RepID=A0A976IGV7_BRELC|nr:hypothetical protein CCR75_006333 [Bremia lactucae]
MRPSSAIRLIGVALLIVNYSSSLATQDTHSATVATVASSDPVESIELVSTTTRSVRSLQTEDDDPSNESGLTEEARGILATTLTDSLRKKLNLHNGAVPTTSRVSKDLTSKPEELLPSFAKKALATLLEKNPRVSKHLESFVAQKGSVFALKKTLGINSNTSPNDEKYEVYSCLLLYRALFEHDWTKIRLAGDTDGQLLILIARSDKARKNYGAFMDNRLTVDNFVAKSMDKNLLNSAKEFESSLYATKTYLDLTLYRDERMTPQLYKKFKETNGDINWLGHQLLGKRQWEKVSIEDQESIANVLLHAALFRIYEKADDPEEAIQSFLRHKEGTETIRTVIRENLATDKDLRLF